MTNLGIRIMKPIVMYGILIIVIIVTSLTALFLFGFVLLFLENQARTSFYTEQAAILFSGDNNSGIIGSPWLFDTNTSSLIPNTAFRELLDTDIRTELQNYSFVTGFTVKYENIPNIFNHTHQFTHNDSPSGYTFDPLYGRITFHYNLSDQSLNKEWDRFIAPLLETAFQNKWYVQRFEFMIATSS